MENRERKKNSFFFIYIYLEILYLINYNMIEIHLC